MLKQQRSDGAWPIGIDNDGEVCAPNVGPGDMPNIGISLIRLNHHTQDEKYLQAAVKTLQYSIAMQAAEGGRYPLHDYSLSGDQSVHHVRGMLFIGDYIGKLHNANFVFA